MTHCTKCEHLYFETETILRCDITHSKCYLDDLPLTVMDDCPLCNNTDCAYHADSSCPAADGCGEFKED